MYLSEVDLTLKSFLSTTETPSFLLISFSNRQGSRSLCLPLHHHVLCFPRQLRGFNCQSFATTAGPAPSSPPASHYVMLLLNLWAFLSFDFFILILSALQSPRFDCAAMNKRQRDQSNISQMKSQQKIITMLFRLRFIFLVLHFFAFQAFAVMRSLCLSPSLFSPGHIKKRVLQKKKLCTNASYAAAPISSLLLMVAAFPFSLRWHRSPSPRILIYFISFELISPIYYLNFEFFPPYRFDFYKLCKYFEMQKESMMRWKWQMEGIYFN